MARAVNLAAYKAYSPLFLSTTFALSYGLSFASITSTIVHAFLYFRRQIWVQARRSLSEQPDIHGASVVTVVLAVSYSFSSFDVALPPGSGMVVCCHFP